MDSRQSSQLTIGLVVIAVGLIMLAGQFGDRWDWNFSRLWPVVFVMLGIGRLVRTDGEPRSSALWMFFLGGIFLLHTFRVLTLSHSWPLFIVAGGLSMMFHRDGDRDRNKRRGMTL